MNKKITSLAFLLATSPVFADFGFGNNGFNFGSDNDNGSSRLNEGFNFGNGNNSSGFSLGNNNGGSGFSEGFSFGNSNDSSSFSFGSNNGGSSFSEGFNFGNGQGFNLGNNSGSGWNSAPGFNYGNNSGRYGLNPWSGHNARNMPAPLPGYVMPTPAWGIPYPVQPMYYYYPVPMRQPAVRPQTVPPVEVVAPDNAGK